ncbi:hypothetical protein N9Q96_04240 [Flavobacteriaceae bacterium]|nr:hypothetical protein [Flavobacteriaceae bacterium]MDB4192504.1 hypothetical protein [Flavobacteriaceae bacterium]MDB9780978.1 hypothetical protein [Flavobacteriaceae bacterium]MDB9798444.1 hypothetical protein [Flavobacteriaceae bacterium]
MRKLSKLMLTLLMIAGVFGTANAQLIDEKDVTVTMDLQPVLQLDMTTANQLEFVFDDINEYYAGITNYAATILKVSSTVSWDLYAVGRSSGSSGSGGFWDQQIDYGSDNTNAINQLPLSLLELRQSQPNSGDANAVTAGTVNTDYSAAFTPNESVSPRNSLFTNTDGSITAPTVADKYIAGHAGATGAGDFMPGGSYMTQTGTTSDYYYAMDYRILPSLPAIFPNAHSADGTTAQDIVTTNGAGTYAEPGVYTMYVQYVLLEDQ